MSCACLFVAAPAAQAAGGGPGRPGYEKPWQQQPVQPRQQPAGGRGAGAKGAPGGEAPVGSNGKARVPYVGPDIELAAMLERDIMEGGPGVK